MNSNQTDIRKSCHSNKSITPFLLAVAAVGLGLAACDSKQEQARKAGLEMQADSLEGKAEAMRDQTKTDAKNMEKVGDLQVEADKAAANARAEAQRVATEEAAKNLKETGQNTADALEEKARQTREAK